MFNFTIMVNINSYKILYDGIFLLKNFNVEDISLFYKVKNIVHWDNTIKSRKTASFGKPYNYSNINYEIKEIPTFIDEIINKIEKIVDFRPNNCLINYYYNENSKMGFHSDQIDILEEGTGIIIISLGSSRIITFKHKLENKSFDIVLDSNSLLYMTQEIQKKWLHAILPSNNLEDERISLTFRRIKD